MTNIKVSDLVMFVSDDGEKWGPFVVTTILDDNNIVVRLLDCVDLSLGSEFIGNIDDFELDNPDSIALAKSSYIKSGDLLFTDDGHSVYKDKQEAYETIPEISEEIRKLKKRNLILRRYANSELIASLSKKTTKKLTTIRTLITREIIEDGKTLIIPKGSMGYIVRRKLDYCLVEFTSEWGGTIPRALYYKNDEIESIQ